MIDVDNLDNEVDKYEFVKYVPDLKQQILSSKHIYGVKMCPLTLLIWHGSTNKIRTWNLL